MIGVGEILAGMNILDKLGKIWNWFRGRRTPPFDSVASRFVRLFENHGVHRNQIPRFFGNGLTLKDVHDDASLLLKLDESILDGACTLFAVRREWLDGAESQVYPCHDFYKSPQDAASFLENLQVNRPEGELGGVLIVPEELDGDALLILHEVIGAVGDKAIYRYHLCNNWDFGYWKSRGYLAACISIAWKHAVYIHGVYMPRKEIVRIAYGENLLSTSGEGVWAFGCKKWDPEDMALRPEVFLHGIDPERNDFGITSGLKLWLDLEEKGYMSTGLTMYRDGDIRQLFQQELAKYEIASV